MALLTLAKLLDEVRDEIPNKEQAPIVRAANKVLRRLQTECLLPQRSTITTKAATTTGTVSVTADSTTATFSSGVLSTSDPLRLVQIDGDSTWFTVTRNAADTAGVLSSAWAEATNATATYKIIYPTLSFPAAVGELLSIWHAGEEPLRFAMNETDVQWQTTVGQPCFWSPLLYDDAAADPNNDLLRIRLHPPTDERIVYSFLYRPRTTFIDTAGATTQTVSIPDLWTEAVVSGTLFFLWKQEANNEKALLHSALYEAAIARARGSSYPDMVLGPRTYRQGMYAYDDRPIG